MSPPTSSPPAASAARAALSSDPSAEDLPSELLHAGDDPLAPERAEAEAEVFPEALQGTAETRKEAGTGKYQVTTREIWNLTWPQALMMLFQFLVGFTDVVVAGYIGSDVQAALGIITQCQFFLLVFGIALVNGGVAAMSQSLGAKLQRRADQYVGLLIKVAALFCLLTMAAGLLFRRELLVLIKVPDAIFPLTLDLWVLLLAILPASYLSITTAAVFRARKMIWVPLSSGIVVCAVNAVGDFGLGLGWFGMPELGGRGLIWASIGAVTAGGLVNLYVLKRTGILSLRSFGPWRWERRALPYVLKVALPAGASQVLWQLGYMVLYLITNTLPGDQVTAVAGLTAGLRVEGILFLPALAFNLTGSILVGHCLGAGDRAEAKRVGLRVVGAGALSMTLVAILLFPWIQEITQFVAPGASGVQAVAASYMMFNLWAVPFTVTSMIMGGIFVGAGATVYSLGVFSVATWLVRLPLAWYMGHVVWQDASGVFVAMLVSQVVQASVLFFIFLRCDWYRFALTAKRFSREKI